MTFKFSVFQSLYTYLDCTGPWQVGIKTDALVGNANAGANDDINKNRGVCLQYTQLPCPGPGRI